nr:unnamed protein product [Callosobruchus analis]
MENENCNLIHTFQESESMTSYQPKSYMSGLSSKKSYELESSPLAEFSTSIATQITPIILEPTQLPVGSWDFGESVLSTNV